MTGVDEPARRAAIGTEARKRVPPESHADFAAAKDRPDPVDVLLAQAAGRLPELVPIRHGRMSVSPFAFLRGAAAVMADDLAGTPVSGLTSQLCGDAHLLNFGLFGTPERRLVFDINDFDETFPGPWEWDVKRLAASFAVAGRGNGFGRKARGGVVLAMVSGYRQAMISFAGMRDLEVWYARADFDEMAELLGKQLGQSRRRQLEKVRSKARSRDSLQAYRKLTAVVDGERRIVADPPLIVPIRDLLPDAERTELEEQLRVLLDRYRGSLADDRRHLVDGFAFVDLARKVVGVGSVGTRCWIVLLAGRDENDPLLLQVKEAGPSALARHLPGPAARPGGEGRRVVTGQRLMQAASDIFLGWIEGDDRDFQVRQLRDWKGAAVVEEMDSAGMRAYASLCGWTLARAHARTGDRIAIAAYLGEDEAFERAVAEFAERYADQTERDHAALVAAAKAGRVEAVAGV